MTNHEWFLEKCKDEEFVEKIMFWSTACKTVLGKICLGSCEGCPFWTSKGTLEWLRAERDGVVEE